VIVAIMRPRPIRLLCVCGALLRADEAQRPLAYDEHEQHELFVADDGA
jgi:hypothetical protein